MVDQTSPNTEIHFFTSVREKRIWAGTLAIILAIYSTLGLASQLAGILNNQGLAAILFLGCMLLVALTIFFQGWGARPGGIEIGAGIGIAVVYFMVFFRLTIPERSHLIEYGVLAVFIYEALAERARNGRRVPVPALLAILATTLIGVIDECIQLFLPNRHFDRDDILFNFLASLMAIVVMVVLGWVRRLFDKKNKTKHADP